jgi:hypothetical protein
MLLICIFLRVNTELLQQGWPFVMFGDGEICKYVIQCSLSHFPIHHIYLYCLYLFCYYFLRCNPISETDLATYMLNCVEDQSKWNKVLNIGGPDEGMTMKQQGEMIFDVGVVETA